MFTLIFVPMRTKAGGKFYPPDCHSNKPAISSRDYIPYTVFRGLILHYGRPSAFTVLVMPEMFTPISDPMRTKAGGKFTHQILYNNEPAIPSRHSVPYTFFEDLSCTTEGLVHIHPGDARNTGPYFRPNACKSGG